MFRFVALLYDVINVVIAFERPFFNICVLFRQHSCPFLCCIRFVFPLSKTFAIWDVNEERRLQCYYVSVISASFNVWFK